MIDWLSALDVSSTLSINYDKVTGKVEKCDGDDEGDDNEDPYEIGGQPRLL